MIHGFFKGNVQSLSFPEIVNSTGKFNSVAVKTLKPIFYFSRRNVPLINKNINKGDKIVYQCGSFEPTLDPSYISLDNTFDIGKKLLRACIPAYHIHMLGPAGPYY